MNRFKKELRKHGVKLECDYECLPYNGIETVVVDSANATVSTYHLSAGWCKVCFNRAFSEEKVREIVRFSSEKQIEVYFALRLEGMSYGEAKRWLEGWCADYKAVCGGSEYTADDLLKVCVDPWDPTRCLPYLCF